MKQTISYCQQPSVIPLKLVQYLVIVFLMGLGERCALCPLLGEGLLLHQCPHRYPNGLPLLDLHCNLVIEEEVKQSIVSFHGL